MSKLPVILRKGHKAFVLCLVGAAALASPAIATPVDAEAADHVEKCEAELSVSDVQTLFDHHRDVIRAVGHRYDAFEAMQTPEALIPKLCRLTSLNLPLNRQKQANVLATPAFGKLASLQELSFDCAPRGKPPIPPGFVRPSPPPPIKLPALRAGSSLSTLKVHIETRCSGEPFGKSLQNAAALAEVELISELPSAILQGVLDAPQVRKLSIIQLNEGALGLEPSPTKGSSLQEFHYTGLRSFAPVGLQNFKNLERVSLKFGRGSSLRQIEQPFPAGITELAHLRHLDIDSGRLGPLPSQAGALNLETLSIKLAHPSLPAWVFQQSNLRSLEYLPPTTIEFPKLASSNFDVPKLEVLKLGSVDKLPDALWNSASLVTLHVGIQGPAPVTPLAAPNLQDLQIQARNWTTLPIDWNRLPKLEIAKFDVEGLTTLPSFAGLTAGVTIEAPLLTNIPASIFTSQASHVSLKVKSVSALPSMPPGPSTPSVPVGRFRIETLEGVLGLREPSFWRQIGTTRAAYTGVSDAYCDALSSYRLVWEELQPYCD